mmetsp:Transcript_28680/g.63113  ORF Transcript_28680/g.63113 Transcript_28680/m.63113 type:complete len:344 (+) Transcript_28680:217-1248(+)
MSYAYASCFALAGIILIIIMSARTSATIESVLITGANSGVGKECARQLSLLPQMKRIVLGCRDRVKAQEAKVDLERATRSRSTTNEMGVVFEILILDLSNIESVKGAIEELTDPVDVVVMNAGGLGGKTPGRVLEDQGGFSSIFCANVAGHVVLLDGLVEAGKLSRTAIYAGSEAARGLPVMGYPKPRIETGSVDEFQSICDGSFFADSRDAKTMYAHTKYVGALWMGSASRQYPQHRMIAVSPGATSGTNSAAHMGPVVQFVQKTLLFPLLKLLGNAHGVEMGARRYVDAILDEGTYQSGHFYASDGPNKMTGGVVDQMKLLDDFGKEDYQDNANAAIHSFL